MRGFFARLLDWLAERESRLARYVNRDRKPGESCNWCGLRIGERDCPTCGRPKA